MIRCMGALTTFLLLASPLLAGELDTEFGARSGGRDTTVNPSKTPAAETALSGLGTPDIKKASELDAEGPVQAFRHFGGFHHGFGFGGLGYGRGFGFGGLGYGRGFGFGGLGYGRGFGFGGLGYGFSSLGYGLGLGYGGLGYGYGGLGYGYGGLGYGGLGYGGYGYGGLGYGGYGYGGYSPVSYYSPYSILGYGYGYGYGMRCW